MATEKDREADIQAAHRDLDPVTDEKKHNAAIDQAKAATDKEHKMTLMQGVRTYPRAIAWSMTIGLCIAMEGYDLCLLNTFCMLEDACGESGYQLIADFRRNGLFQQEVRRTTSRRHVSSASEVADWVSSGQASLPLDLKEDLC